VAFPVVFVKIDRSPSTRLAINPICLLTTEVIVISLVNVPALAPRRLVTGKVPSTGLQCSPDADKNGRQRGMRHMKQRGAGHDSIVGLYLIEFIEA